MHYDIYINDKEFNAAIQTMCIVFYGHTFSLASFCRSKIIDQFVYQFMFVMINIHFINYFQTDNRVSLNGKRFFFGRNLYYENVCAVVLYNYEQKRKRTHCLL